MNLQKIIGMKFKSGPYAMRDIHNAGSILGVIYCELPQFHNNKRVTIHNEIILNRSKDDWLQSIESTKWEGTYSIDIDNKHVKCELINLLTNASQEVYADFASNELLLSEVYEGQSNYGQGKVFIKID